MSITLPVRQSECSATHMNVKRKPSEERVWENRYTLAILPPPNNSRTLYQEIRDRNADHLDDIAISTPFLQKETYGQLQDKINEVARALVASGVKEGDVVPVCIAGIPEFAHIFYALSKIGAISYLVPIPIGNYNREHFKKTVKNKECTIAFFMDGFLTEDTLRGIQESNLKEVFNVPLLYSSPLKIPVGLINYLKKIIEKLSGKSKAVETASVTQTSKINKYRNFLKRAQDIDDVEESQYYPGKIETIMSTSGTTRGEAKGIITSGDSIINSTRFLEGTGVVIERGKKYYCLIPPSYSTGLTSSVHMVLSAGGDLFFDPRYDRKVFVENLLKYDLVSTIAAKSMYEGFLDSDNLTRYKKGKYDLSTLEYPFQGGEPINIAEVERIEEAMRNLGYKGKIYNGYGTTENGPSVSTQSLNVTSPGSSGIPLPYRVPKIVNSNGEELDYGEVGRLLVYNPYSTFSGYLDGDGVYEDYFIYDDEGKRWNVTGDYGYMIENGELYVVGRENDVTQIAGKTYVNADLEMIIMDDHDVVGCAVMSFEDTDGEGEFRVHLIFSEELRRKLGDNNDLIEKKLTQIQNRIFHETEDRDFVPKVFKLRKSFPQNYTGKRNVLELRSETTGFIRLDYP
ncbi:MAG: acyl--CoA ligase [Lentisphaerae bacterium]|nr:acyl--CoA ligase [Lentisphaerota bacterium]